MAPGPHQLSWHLAVRALRAPLACLWLAVGAAEAAEIKVLRSDNTAVQFITVIGQFELSDGESFAQAAARVDKAVVVFDSPGGILFAGLQIGTVIRSHHFATFVPEGVMCASACAIAWLAGKPLVMQPGSRIGFHAAFAERNDGTKAASNVGNALVGAFLSKLGYSFAAIAYFEQADPDDVTWLTVADARRIGLGVRVLAPSPPSATPPGPDAAPDEPRRDEPKRSASREPVEPPRRSVARSYSILDPELSAPEPEAPALTPSAPMPMEEQARQFVDDYFAHWSESGAEALRYFSDAYAGHVVFYGKNLDRGAVIAGKRGFTQRWPARIYSPRPKSIRVLCNPDNHTCTVSGIVDWDCRSATGDAATAGSANFMITATLVNGRPQILAENGSVIARAMP